MRLLLLAAVLAVASGCSSTTRVVDRTDAAALVGVDSLLRGRAVTLYLAPNREESGRLTFVRPDLTGWDDGTPRTAPTADVLSIVDDNRAKSVRRGALVGAGIGAGFVGLALATRDRDPDTFGEELDRAVLDLLGIVSIPIWVGYGTLGGAVVGRRVEYVFTGDAATASSP